MTGTTEVAATKKTRGEGLVKIMFSDGAKHDHKRVPKGVTSVIVNGKHYALTDIPEATKQELVAYALKGRYASYVNNHAEEGAKPEAVHVLTDKLHTDLKAGILYAETSEGGVKKSKEFDPTDWVEACKNARALAHKANPASPLATPEQLAALAFKLKAMTPKECVAFTKKLKDDPLIGPAYQNVMAMKRVKAYMAGDKKPETSVMDEIF